MASTIDNILKQVLEDTFFNGMKEDIQLQVSFIETMASTQLCDWLKR